jgi:hypothetical protein
MKYKNLILTVFLILNVPVVNLYSQNFPDETPIPTWFSETKPSDISLLGTKYVITDFGVKKDSIVLQTKEIQSVIDNAARNGGGVVVVPEGTFLSGSLFFRQGVHLHLDENAVLKGSDDISDFKMLTTRLEGQTLKYFAALINADGLDGFTISGKGTVNGNGFRYWRSFWLRRQYNPKCTNLEEMRPRLLYISNCRNVQISDVRLINSPFWTSHYYKCENLKILDVYIYAPKKDSGTPAPSSDGIDLDVCRNVLIKGCYISVNDDGICLKGGKGPVADKDENNGANCNIIIEDITINNCPALTLGSESVHTRNVIFRRSKVIDASYVLLLKMRPDTPQKHEYVSVEGIAGTSRTFLSIAPWTQFFDLQGYPQPKSWARNIVMRNCKVDCNVFFNVNVTDQFTLSDFTFENLEINAKKGDYDKSLIINSVWKNVIVNERN